MRNFTIIKKKFAMLFLAAVSATGPAFGQANISILAPEYDGSYTQLRLPNGSQSHKHMRGCHLVKSSELAALTGTDVTSVSIWFLDGATPASSGGFTLYLENTSDATYLKGTNFTTAITTMSAYYNGTLNIPTTANSSTVNLAFAPNFTYTGGGIYVAYAWDEISPSPNNNLTNSASFPASYLGAGNGLCATASSSVSPAPTAMTISDFRPCLIFNAVNTATNEVGVVSMEAVGRLTKLAGAPQIIRAVVKNNSIGTLNNVQVGLAITGTNPFTDAQTVASIAAGGQATVNFTAYSPTTNGTSTMAVSVLPDQNASNDLRSWNQEISCDRFALPSPLLASSYASSGYGAGGNTGGLAYAFKYTSGTPASSLTGVNCVVPSFTSAANSGKQLFATLFDANGAVVANGKTVTIGSSQMDVFYNYSFAAPVALTPNTTYYVGITIPTNSYFPIGSANALIDGFYTIPNGGGAPTAINFGYLSIEATLGYSNTIISASASRTTICNKSSETTTLTATGVNGLTYTWTPGNASSTTIVVNPTISATSGATTYAVVAKDPVSGCTSNKAVVTVSLANCTGLDNNGDFGSNISIFPNPAVNGKTYIKGLDGSSKVEVFNILGQVVLTLSPTESEVEINLSNQPVGSYLVKITGDNKKSKTIKVLNQN